MEYNYNKKITGQQLYDMARKRELEEYREAVNKMAKVCGSYVYDEDNKTDVDEDRPVVTAAPKHYEGVGNFTVVGIDEYGMLNLDDEWGNTLEDEEPDTLEYAHLQYVTDFVWELVENKLVQNLKTLMQTLQIDSVDYRGDVTIEFYNGHWLKESREIVIQRIYLEEDTDKLIFVTDGDLTDGEIDGPIQNILFEDRIPLLENLIKQLSCSNN